jgi:hypothetical protein
MALTADQALSLIIEEARRRGRVVRPGKRVYLAAGKLFEAEVHVSPDGLSLWIDTIDGTNGFGVSMTDWRGVVSYGNKISATMSA